jgi:chromosome partitioning protein
LDLVTGDHGAVSTPQDEVVARAREIFERLRQASQPPPEVVEATGEHVSVASPVAAEPDQEAGEGTEAIVDHIDPDPLETESIASETLSSPAASEAEEPAGVSSPAVDAALEPEPASEPEPVALAPAVVTSAMAHPLPRIMAIANQKGGVGKTTTAVNLGAALAELGYRVLVVDLDPQGNATTGLGINSRNLDVSLYDVIMHDVPLEDCVEPTSVRNLFVAPATIDLAGAEIELVPAFSRELKLKRALQQGADDYDFTLIDCPPSLGLLTVNGLAAATEVVVPIQCEYYALEGLGQLLRNVALVKGNLNPTLDMSTIILTMYDARTKLAEQVATEVRQHFGAKVCRNIVPRTVRLSEAPSFGQPIIVFDPSSRGAIAYRELAKEVSGGAPQRVG